MLTIICGEDTVESRKYYIELQDSYRKKGFSIENIDKSSINNVIDESSEVPDLFGFKRIFVTQHLNKLVKRRGDRAFKLIESLDSNEEVIVISWETSAQRELKFKPVKIKEFKPAKNIFQLLGSCYPSNLLPFTEMLQTITNSQNEMFIFIMLTRHLRNVLMALSGNFPPALQSWQLNKLKSQAAYWTKDKLLGFYDGLYRIDSSLKSGRNPHGVKNSLDILACYFLK